MNPQSSGEVKVEIKIGGSRHDPKQRLHRCSIQTRRECVAYASTAAGALLDSNTRAVVLGTQRPPPVLSKRTIAPVSQKPENHRLFLPTTVPHTPRMGVALSPPHRSTWPRHARLSSHLLLRSSCALRPLGPLSFFRLPNASSFLCRPARFCFFFCETTGSRLRVPRATPGKRGGAPTKFLSACALS